jgi:hypothetical protein
MPTVPKPLQPPLALPGWDRSEGLAPRRREAASKGARKLVGMEGKSAVKA